MRENSSVFPWRPSVPKITPKVEQARARTIDDLHTLRLIDRAQHEAQAGSPAEVRHGLRVVALPRQHLAVGVVPVGSHPGVLDHCRLQMKPAVRNKNKGITVREQRRGAAQSFTCREQS